MGNYREDNMLEKYYTPKDFTNYLIDRFEEMTIWRPTSILEPTAGGGDMIDVIKERFKEPVEAYDIFNETNREDIVEGDYMKLKLGYKEGRMTIANYPFSKALKMMYKSLEESDFVVAMTGVNTIINFDYDKYEKDFFVHRILVKKNLEFIGCTAATSVFFIQRKSIIDPLELEELKKKEDWI